MEKYISALIISFFIYGFCGWIWESFVCPILTGHRIKNSGFLNGPIVPIYGVGAIVITLLFSPTESYLSIFLEGAVVACVIEYLTSWAMEKLYHRRWWDYSHKAFHVNGRVCLEGFLVFGLFGMVVVKFIQPLLMRYILKHSLTFLIAVASSLTTIIFMDLITTLSSLTQFEEHLEEFIKEVEDYAQKALNEFERKRMNHNEILEIMKEKDLAIYQDIKNHRKYIEKRIFNAFPELMNKKKK